MKRLFVFCLIVVPAVWISGCKKSSGPTGAPPPCQGTQEAEPNNNVPQSLGTLGATDLTVCGITANANDIDLYSIDFQGGGNLHVSVAWSGGSDLDLGVMNSNSVMINFQDTGANPERCTLPSLSAGTYQIHVSTKTASATGYTLTIGRR